MSLSVTTIAGAHKGKVGRMISHPRYDAIHEKKNFTREQPMHPPKVPQKAQVYRTGVPNLSLIMYPLLNFL